jgi:hypothetical protein
MKNKTSQLNWTYVGILILLLLTTAVIFIYFFPSVTQRFASAGDWLGNLI